MKKLTLSIVAVVTALVMVLGMTACGMSDETKLEKFVASESFQSELESLQGQFASQMDINAKSEGTTLVFEFKYKTQIDGDASKEALETGLDSLKSTFEDMANTIKEDLKIEEPKVKLIVQNADGSEITSLEYAATK